MTNQFQLKAPFKPAGDQPKAIRQLVEGIKRGIGHQTLLGVTGSGKTATMAWVMETVQKPALVISHNKTLAAQLAEEFKEFFPENAVQYFVSYYDYYQPEAYLPRTDTYIAKDASINDEIDRLRHSAMEAVLTRQDVIVVASVSCIYGIGSPADHLNMCIELAVRQQRERNGLLKELTRLQYTRNDLDLIRGTYRVRGDIVDIHPSGEERILRVQFFGPTIERLVWLDDLTGQVLDTPTQTLIFPATFFLTPPENRQRALHAIRKELAERIQYFKRLSKAVEAQRIEQRTKYDLEMIKQIGYVGGIENYSRHLDGRRPGQPPATLLDYFAFSFGRDGFLTFIDESHMTVPQIAGMYGGDKARKDTLVEHGFRLPSARDNRPLKFDEFEDRLGQAIFVSATPGPYEHEVSEHRAEQIVRPTGLLDPTITVKPTLQQVQGKPLHQVDDVINEIQQRVSKGQRTLVTTLTKRMAEDLSTYLVEMGIKAAYLHSDIDTLERLDILHNLRRGTYDVLVGINLLREGLDLPEVSLVAIMDADKEGYLRSQTALIQVMGRAARHIDSHVIMYADTITGSMQRAMDETQRRRAIQKAYNRKHHITPQSITKAVRKLTFAKTHLEEHEEIDPKDIPVDEVRRAIKELEAKMDLAARNLEFERAAQLRDKIQQLRKQQRHT